MSQTHDVDPEVNEAEVRVAALRDQVLQLEQFISARRQRLSSPRLTPEVEKVFAGDEFLAVLIDKNSRIVRATAKFLRAFDVSSVVGTSLRDALALRVTETATPWVTAVVSSDPGWEHRVMQTRDGRWFTRRSVPILDEDAAAAGAVVTFTPIQARGVLEERLKLAMESARLVWWDWDFGTGTLGIYGSSACLLGYAVDTLPRSAVSWFDLTHPDDLVSVQEAVENAMAGRTPEWSVEQRLRAADGSWRWVLNSAKLAEFDGLGRATRMLGIVIDIHARRLAEDHLRRDSDILAQLDDAIVCMDRDGLVTYWNAASARTFGWTAEEMVGRDHASRSSSPKERSTTISLFEQAAAGTRVCGERHETRKDGSTFWAESTFAAICDAKGNAAGVVAVFRDVSERKLAEADLQRDARILAQLQDVVIYCDAACRIAYVNDAFEAVFGWSKASAIGQDLTYRMPAHAGNHEIHNFHRRVLGGGAFTGEWEDYRANGSRVWVQWRCQPIVDSAGKLTGVINIVTDIDARKRAEIEREQLQRQVIQAQRMDTLGSLAGGIAHDFNNILSVIFGFTEIAIATTNPGDQSKHYHLQVLNAAERARELVKRILSFSRFHEPERRPVCLKGLVEDALKFIRAALPSTVEMTAEFECDCPPTLADSHQLQQVLMNLATNSAHAIGDDKGCLSLRLRCETLRTETFVATGALGAGRYALLEVTDTGQGMDAETQAKIFDPFFTTKKEGEGTGLGLSVVSAIMQGHQGGVAVRSAPGRGTTFTIYLPLLANISVPVTSPDEAFAPRIRARGETIAIIDDEEMVASTAGKILQGLGYITQTFPSASRFLEVFSMAPTGVSLLLTDQTMPRLTGIELALRLRQEGHRLPILIMTGFSTQLQPSLVAGVGRATVIKKPFARLELAQAVRALLDCE